MVHGRDLCRFAWIIEGLIFQWGVFVLTCGWKFDGYSFTGVDFIHEMVEGHVSSEVYLNILGFDFPDLGNRASPPLLLLNLVLPADSIRALKSRDFRFDVRDFQLDGILLEFYYHAGQLEVG